MSFQKQYTQNNRRLYYGFSKKEFNTIYSIQKRIEYNILYLLAYCGGLRISEAFNLEKDNFIDGEEIRIFNSKGGKDRITLYVPWEKDYYFKEEWMSLLPISKRIKNINSVKRSFRHILKKANLLKPRFNFKTKSNKIRTKYFYSFHSLRHSYALNLLDQGLSLNYVQELLGHSDISTTSHYTKLNPTHIKEKIKEKLKI